MTTHLLPKVLSFIFLFIFLLLATASVPAQSKQTLQGHILDTSGAPLAGAAVLLLQRNSQIELQTVSQTDGTFSFSGVASGNYLLAVNALNFRSTVREVSIPETQNLLEIQLAVAGINDEVIVTASGTPQTIAENSRAVTTVNNEEINQRDETLVTEALRTVPGLRINQRGGPGAFTSVRFHGLRPSDTSVLIDGLRVRDASGFRGDFGSVFSDLIVNNLDRIEVVRGSSGPLYGTAATGGVINLVSRTGSGDLHGDAGFEGGTLAQVRERFSLAGGFKEKFSYSFGLTRTDVNNGLDGNDVFRNTSLSTRMAYNWTPNLSLSGSFTYSNSPRTNLNSSPIPIGPKGNEFGFESGKGPVVGFLTDLDDPDLRRQSSLLTGWLSFKQRVNSIWSYSVSYQGTQAKRNFSNGPKQNPLLDSLGLFDFPYEISRFDGFDHLFETRHTLQLGPNNLLTLGFEHERERFDQDFASAGFGILSSPTTDRQNSTAFFFNDQFSFLQRKLQLGFGFRTQHFDIDNPQSVPELKGLKTPSAYTGDGSLSYYLDRTHTKIRAHVGNSFRAPSLSERFSSIVTSVGRIRIGNPLIRPERAINVDGGLDQTFYDGKLRLSGTYFYSRLQETIVSTEFLKEVNTKGGLSRGVECEGTASPMRGLDVRLAYTYTRSTFVPPLPTLRADNTIALAGIARRQQGIPDHQVSVGINYAVSRWNFNFDFTGISHYDEVVFSPNAFRPVLFTFDGYKKADLGVSYTFPLSDHTSLRLYTKIDNVFRNRYFEDGFRTPGVVALGGARFQF